MLSPAVTPNTSPETSPDVDVCPSPSEKDASEELFGKGQDKLHIDSAANLHEQFNEHADEAPSPPLTPVGNPLENLKEICSCSDCQRRGSLWDHIQKLSDAQRATQQPPRARLFAKPEKAERPKTKGTVPQGYQKYEKHTHCSHRHRHHTAAAVHSREPCGKWAVTFFSSPPPEKRHEQRRVAGSSTIEDIWSGPGMLTQGSQGGRPPPLASRFYRIPTHFALNFREI